MMATRTMSLGNQNIGFLKETLNEQQELLQKLYNELDVERESSATAADETLSMILRLQAEKSAMEMEASQYKRIAEEKICHTQEILETFQEAMYNKEMQIASLEFQVQAYKFKLTSLGFDDLTSSELQYPDNMLRKNGVVAEIDENSSRMFRRGYSLPPRANNGLGKRVENNPYLEDIKKLDERVKNMNISIDENSDFDEHSEKVVIVDVEVKPETGTEISPKPKDTERKIDYEGKIDEKRKLFKHLTFGVGEFEQKQFKRRIKQLEDERILSRVSEVDEESRDEELKLLREILEKVEAVQSELTSLRTGDNPRLVEKRSLGCFKEVMQCFLP